MKTLIGIISDTHGVMRQEALDILKGCQIIIHAGDIGSIEVIKTLERIKPVYVVRGNNDKGTWADQLPTTRMIKINDVSIYVIHDIKKIDLDPKLEGFDIVISGHSHKFSKTIKDGIMFINPGSAGPRRFNLPLTVVLLHLDKDKNVVEIKYL